MQNTTDVELAGVAAVRRQLDDWRATKKGRGRIPEKLWDQAVHLARMHGVSCVARALGVHHSRLRDKVETTPQRETPMPEFVEFSFSGSATAPPPCTVELQRPDGAQMTVHSPTIDGLEVLSRAFLGVKPC